MDITHVKGDEPFVKLFGCQFAIGFLEPLPDLAKAGGPVLVVDTVIRDAVDEEKRQNLDAL
jgi:hypothetical protein